MRYHLFVWEDKYELNSTGYVGGWRLVDSFRTFSELTEFAKLEFGWRVPMPLLDVIAW